MMEDRTPKRRRRRRRRRSCMKRRRGTTRGWGTTRMRWWGVMDLLQDRHPHADIGLASSFSYSTSQRQ
jgi:hypothetical protein